MKLDDFPWVTGESHETGTNREFQPENANHPEWDGTVEKPITLAQYNNAGKTRGQVIADYANQWDEMDQTPVYDGWDWLHVSRETDNGLNSDKTDMLVDKGKLDRLLEKDNATNSTMLDDIRDLLNPVGWDK
jgi:hypothetical protein